MEEEAVGGRAWRCGGCREEDELPLNRVPLPVCLEVWDDFSMKDTLGGSGYLPTSSRAWWAFVASASSEEPGCVLFRMFYRINSRQEPEGRKK